MAFDRALGDQSSFFNGFEHNDLQHLNTINEVLKDAKALARKVSTALRSLGYDHLLSTLTVRIGIQGRISADSLHARVRQARARHQGG